MTKIRLRPCDVCPYRRDVPSGVWHPDEYEKLRPYDAFTGNQPPNAFACHASPELLCNGWAICHSSRGHAHELLALRIRPVDIPEPVVPLFGSANEAADHGQRDADEPGDVAVAAMDRLLRRGPAHIKPS